MSDVEQKSKFLGIVKELSQFETNELELMLAIFKKTVNKSVDEQTEILTNEFDNACAAYGKNPSEMVALRDEIVGGYEKEFYRIKERWEEQYVNLIFELQEIQSNQKIAVTNFMKLATKDFTSSEDMETMDMLIEKYGNYCGLEEECYKMMEECVIGVPFLIETVMKFEDKQIATKNNIGIINKIKTLIRSLFKSNKFEINFVEVKRAKIIKIRENTDNVVEEIRDNTVNYVETLASYKNQIKEAANANIVA